MFGGVIVIYQTPLTIGSSPSPIKGMWATLGSGDVDGDGKRDMGLHLEVPNLQQPVVTYADFWVKGLGNGLFATTGVVKLSEETKPVSGYVSDALLDVDGDGKVEVIAKDTTLGISWNLGNATFMEGPTFDNVTGRYGVADFNGDTKPDLYLGDSTGLSIRPGDGARGFGAAIAHVQGTIFQDFNGDGATDIALVNGYGRTSIYLSTAKGAAVSAADLQCSVQGCTQDPSSF
jgi:hypothetical protein